MKACLFAVLVLVALPSVAKGRGLLKDLFPSRSYLSIGGSYLSGSDYNYDYADKEARAIVNNQEQTVLIKDYESPEEYYSGGPGFDIRTDLWLKQYISILGAKIPLLGVGMFAQYRNMGGELSFSALGGGVGVSVLYINTRVSCGKILSFEGDKLRRFSHYEITRDKKNGETVELIYSEDNDPTGYVDISAELELSLTENLHPYIGLSMLTFQGFGGDYDYLYTASLYCGIAYWL